MSSLYEDYDGHLSNIGFQFHREFQNYMDDMIRKYQLQGISLTEIMAQSTRECINACEEAIIINMMAEYDARMQNQRNQNNEQHD